MLGHRIMVALVGFGALVGSASAGAESSSLRRARQAYEDLDYDRILPLLRKALPQASTLAEEAEIFELMAQVHTMYGRSAKAEAAFIELLRRNPDYQPPANASPKIIAVLDVARRELPKYELLVPVEPVVEDTANGEEVVAVDSEVDGPTRPPPPGVTVAEAPIWETWWFWTAAGAGVVLVAGGIYLGWRASWPDKPDSDFGPYELP